MPSKKLKRDLARPKPPPSPAQPDERAGKESNSGLSGRGADSVLAHLIEQEKIRARKPQSN